MSTSFKSIRYFIAVAESGSISAAIHELGVSQSVVSQAIAQIEADLGTLLFERRARGMSLTHAGHQFLRHAHQIEVAMRNARDALSSRPHTVTGSLNIGVTSLMVGYYLPFLLERFKRVFPRIDVHITEDRRDYLEHLLVSGELDVALIVVSQLQNYRALATETILRSGWRVWCPVNHRLAGEEKVFASDLAQHALVLLQVDELGDASTALWNDAGSDPKVLIRTSSVEAVRSLVATGAGCSVLPDMLYRPWSLEGDRIEARPLAVALPALDVGLAWRKGAALPESLTNFLTAVRPTLASQNAASTGHIR
ncbi:LysR family transcriptional regulator [Rhodoferax aquaticus]|uniref:LysR family transcriptional regulator n=1 Tax=Rhodoferax aquaticus TaxID=2527691 RepID=A0A515EQ06_9BURK|nr:LysR family transcriptional regulator [Rhodoferax aquaticus]QDL54754.1 LysR family transcriptional regulator [Rhodoferax aquaticus]